MLSKVVAVLFLLFGFVSCNDVYQGCFRLRYNSKQINSSWSVKQPGECCIKCQTMGLAYAGISNGTLCSCFNTTSSLDMIDRQLCDIRCISELPTSTCGGKDVFSVYVSNFPVILNASLVTKRITVSEKQMPVLLNASAQLGNIVGSWSILINSQVHNANAQILWEIDNKTVKLSSRKMSTNDVLFDAFSCTLSAGIHGVCVRFLNNISTTFACKEMTVVGNLSSLKVVSTNGILPARGLYVFKWKTYGKFNISVSATSFSSLQFYFNDSSFRHTISSQISTQIKNACLKVWEISHMFHKIGYFQVVLTAFNQFENRSITLNGLLVQDLLKEVSITTEFLTVGKEEKIVLNVQGNFSGSTFRWRIGSRRRKTVRPYLIVKVPVHSPQYKISVDVRNHISHVSTSRILYVLPNIFGAQMLPAVRNVILGRAINFQVSVNKSHVAWLTVETFFWDFGDGAKISGSSPKITYNYKKTGRFLAIVRVKNYISSALSNKAIVEVHEPITKLHAYYKTFRFGDITEFYCTLLTGSDVEYIWNFGDRTRTIRTKFPNATHLYNKIGEFFPSVEAKNLISRMEVSLRLFVVDFYCQKPDITVFGGNYKDITYSEPLRLNIGLNVNCSESLVPLFRWSIYRKKNKFRKLINPSTLNVSTETFRARNLLIPQFRITPGHYRIIINVTMRNTIVHSSVEIELKVSPTPLKAIIAGGTTKVIGQRNGEVIIDGSQSMDPDDAEKTRGLRYLWHCVALQNWEQKACFKSSIKGLYWNASKFHFMANMLQKQADFYIFTLTVMKESKKNATVAQTITTKSGSLYRLGIKCRNCRDELETDQMLQFVGECRNCPTKANLVFEWKLFYNQNAKLFVNIHGKCVNSNGSSWKVINIVEKEESEKNATTDLQKKARTTPAKFTHPISDFNKADVSYDSLRQFIICSNGSDRIVSLVAHNGLVHTVLQQSEHEIDRKGSKDSSRHRQDLAFDSNFRTGRVKRSTSTASERVSTVPDFVKRLGYGVKLRNLYSKASLALPASTPRADYFHISVAQGAKMAAMVAFTDKGRAMSQFSVKPTSKLEINGGKIKGGAVTSRPSKPLGTPSGKRTTKGNGSGVTWTRFPHTNGRFGTGGNTDTGVGITNGRATGSGGRGGKEFGTGKGCPTSEPGNRRSGKGTGVPSGSSCSGHESKFGEGSANTNGTKKGETGESSNGTAGSNGNFKDKEAYQVLHNHVKLMNKIYHPVELERIRVADTVLPHTLVIKKDSLIQGQIYLLEYSAYWINGNHKRLAGQAKLYFKTDRGPILGWCVLDPPKGEELKTWFKIRCQNWKDEHYPLRYQARLKSKPQQGQYSIIYDGFDPEFSFMLSAGEKVNNYTVELAMTVSDSNAASVTLCPISVQVFPRENAGSLVEEELYNMTHTERNGLIKYQESSDLPGLIGFLSAIAHKLNRQSPLKQVSSSFHLRHDIRRRLLETMQTFRRIDMDDRHMVVTALRDITGVPGQLLLASADIAVTVSEKLIISDERYNSYHDKKLSVDFYSDFLDVISLLLENARFLSTNDRLSKDYASQVDRLMSLQFKITQLQLRSSKTGNAKYIIGKPFLRTRAQRHQNFSALRVKDFGVEFVVGKMALGNQNSTVDCFESQTTVFQSNPYAKRSYGGSMINTKVANFDVQKCGGSRKISVLNEDVAFSLEVGHSKQYLSKGKSYSIQWGKQNIHSGNVSKSLSSSALKISIKVISKLNRLGYTLRVLFRFTLRGKNTMQTYPVPLNGSLGTLFIPKDKLKDAGKYFVNVFIVSRGRNRKRMKIIPSYEYQLDVLWTSCLFWNKQSQFWSDLGCRPTEESNLSKISCRIRLQCGQMRCPTFFSLIEMNITRDDVMCNHLTLFGGSSSLAPMDVRVSRINQFTWSRESPLVFLLVSVVVFLYLILSLGSILKDRNDQLPQSVLHLPENHPSDPSRYHIRVETGHCKDAGTTARVTMILFGNEGRSSSREITCQGFNMFQRGSSCDIYSSYPNMIGDLHKVHILHNNEGKSPNWYLKHITVIEEFSGKTWHFPCHTWLAVDRGLKKTECVIKASDSKETAPAQILCRTLLEYHLWLSIITKPVTSCFTRKERLLLCFFVLMGYMLLTAVWIDIAGAEKYKSFGLLPVLDVTYNSSLFACAIVAPLYLAFLYIFCNSKAIDIKSWFTEIPYKKIDMYASPRRYGAMFYMMVMKNVQKRNTHAQIEKTSVDTTTVDCCLAESVGIGCRIHQLSSVWRLVAWTVCFFLSFLFGTLTILYGLSFNEELSLLWMQTVLISFMQDVMFLQLAVVLFVTICHYVKYGTRGQEASRPRFGSMSDCSTAADNGPEVNEELTLVVRNRARFSRYSKPLRGSRLQKARHSQMKRKKALVFIREMLLAVLFISFIALALTTARVQERYETENNLRNNIQRDRNGTSLAGIETIKDVWHWLNSSSPQLLVWSNWYDVLREGAPEPKVGDMILTFGPGRLQQKFHNGVRNDDASLLVSENSSKMAIPLKEDSRYERFSRKGANVVLLGCSQRLLVKALTNLKEKNWIQLTPSDITLDFVSFETHSGILSSSRVLFSISNFGKITTESHTSSYVLEKPWTGTKIIFTVAQMIILIWTLYALNKEFGSFMDHGMAHFKNFWRILEALIIIAVMTSTAFLACYKMAVFDIAYKMSFLDFDDSQTFIDMSSLVRCEKGLRYSFGIFSFLATIRILRFCRLLLPLQNVVNLLRISSKNLVSYTLAIALVMMLLSHTGSVLFSTMLHNYINYASTLSSTLGILCLKSSQNFRFSELLQYHSGIIAAIYQAVAMVLMFFTWRLSAVLFLRNFSTKKKRKRQYYLSTFPLMTLRFLRNLVTNVKGTFAEKPWKILCKRKRERYFPSSIPIEHAYDEIQSQVEEMLFRVDSLFGKSDNKSDYAMLDENTHSYYFQESDYTSRYSDESLSDQSEFSDSCMSEDVYNQSKIRDAGQDSDTINFSREDSSLNLYSENGSYSGIIGSEHLFLPVHSSGFKITNRLQTFKLSPANNKQPRFHQADNSSPKTFTLHSDKTLEKLKNWSPYNQSVPPLQRMDRGNKPIAACTNLGMLKDDIFDSSEGEFSFDPIITKKDFLEKAEQVISKPKHSLPRLSWPRSILNNSKVTPFRSPDVPPTIDQLMARKRRNSSLRNFKVYPMGSDQSSSEKGVSSNGVE